MDFRKWVKKGKCSHVPKFTSPFQKVVPKEFFYPCFDEYLDGPMSKIVYAEGVWEEASAQLDNSILEEKIRTGKIVGYKGSI